MRNVNTRIRGALFVGCLLVASPSLAQFWGSGWGGGPAPKDGACFYEDPYYGGRYLCVATGEALMSLPTDVSDRVSSIRVFGEAEVVAFEDVGFLGRARRYVSDVPDLQNAGANDQVSSLQVKQVSSSATGSPYWAGTTTGGALPEDGACFYEEPNYRGEYFCVEAGRNLSTLPDAANDHVSSIRILGNAEVTVYKDPRLSGESVNLTVSTPDLYASAFNDEISSIEIRGSLDSGVAVNSPDAIIRRAYQDILEREPDPAGLRIYRSYIIDQRWTEQQVRDALRNSPEYKQKNTMTPAKAQEIVRLAYWAVLNRAPDPASRGYVDCVLRDGWTQQDVERELRKSRENQRQ